MKQYKFFGGVLFSILLLTSCTDIVEIDNPDEPEKLEKVTFEVTCGDINGTRTSLASNGISVNWEEGDRFMLAAPRTNAAGVDMNDFAITKGAGTNCGEADGKINSGDNIKDNEFYAVYPYAGLGAGHTYASLTNDGRVTPIKMPAMQTAKEGNFDRRSNLMTAYSTSRKLHFKQVVCYVAIKAPVDCDAIVFNSNNDEEILAGIVDLTIGKDGVATYKVVADGVSSVALVPEEGKTLKAGETYYVGILPQTLKEGFTVACYTYHKTYYARYTKSTDVFARDKIVDISKNNPTWHEHVCDHYYDENRTTDKAYAENHWVNFGDGTKWSTVNLGADHPWEYGDYYAFGATEPWLRSYDMRDMSPDGGRASAHNNHLIAEVHESHKKDYTNADAFNHEFSDPKCYHSAWVSQGICQWHPHNRTYDWSTTPYYTGMANIQLRDGSNALRVTFSKYAEDDAKLSTSDDAAAQRWKDGWRMPTYSEFEYLAENAYWEWTDSYVDPLTGDSTGIRGYIVYKVEDKNKKAHAGIKCVPWSKGENPTDTDENLKKKMKKYIYNEPLKNDQGENFYNTKDNDHIFFPNSGGVAHTRLKSSGYNGYARSINIHNDSEGVYHKDNHLIMTLKTAWNDDSHYINGVIYETNLHRYFGYPIRPVK